MTAHPHPEALLGSPAQALRVGRPEKGWSVSALSLAAIALAGGAVASAAVSGAAVEARLLFLASGVLIGLRLAFGLLPGFGLHPEARLRGGISCWLAAALITLASALILSPAGMGEIFRFLLIFAGLGLVQPLVDRLVRRGLSRLGLWGQPVFLAGEAAAVEGLRDWLLAHPQLGLRPEQDASLPNMLWADEKLPDPQQLALLGRKYATVTLVHDLPRQHLTGIHPASAGWQIGLRLTTARPSRLARKAKRVVDLALALPLFIIALPIIGIAAIAIKLKDPGPSFYTQTRDGLKGKPFGLLKLRTMYMDADHLLAELIARDPEARQEWETHYKLRHDPRILPVIGNLLRRSSLDELPQLLNVLRGDMSMVGPRPFPPYHLDAMPPAFRNRRAKVIPGLTGLCQISERGSADLVAQQQLDEFYLDGRGFWTDLSIFLRTFGAVFGRGGAF